MCQYETIKPYNGSENWLETRRLKHVVLDEVTSLVIAKGGEAGARISGAATVTPVTGPMRTPT
jgi:hypothetical protein